MLNERMQKYKRIQQLDSWGFNTPEMLICLPDVSSPNTLDEVEDFLSKRDIANIRTYRFVGEGIDNPHLLQQPTSILKSKARELVGSGFVILVEDFSNAFTTYNGTLLLEASELSPDWVMDFCIGRRKTVRMVDRYIHGSFDDLSSLTGRIPKEIAEIVDIGASLCPIRPVLLEWSWSTIPQGKMKQNAIFWEYRYPHVFRPVYWEYVWGTVRNNG